MSKKQKAPRPLMRMLYDSRLFFGWYIRLCEPNRIPRKLEKQIRSGVIYGRN